VHDSKSRRRLKELLESIRHRLVYHKATNPSGLPVILLARLPHQLIDVLILIEAPNVAATHATTT